MLAIPEASRSLVHFQGLALSTLSRHCRPHRYLHRPATWQGLSGARNGFSSERQVEEEKQETPEPPEPRTFGEKLVVFGLALRGAALLPRFAPAAQLLRFAGVGPMAVGAAVSLYELGGWRLVLAVPGSVGLAVSASILTEKKLEDQLKEEVQRRLGDVALPKGLLLALPSAKVSNFETNRCKFEATYREEDGPTWHLEVRAERQNFPCQWEVTKIHVKSGSTAPLATGQASLPPQTRHWDPQQEVLKWITVWSAPENALAPS